jgi:adenosylmethionine-8-amino-7-oxononanoate aminotransferase
VLVKGEGVWLEDDRGRRYIDAMAGLWCVNVGYGRREIAEALQRQATELSFCHAFSGLSSDKPVAPRIVKAASARGAIGRALPSADTIAFSPPFVISESAKSIRR